MTRTKTVVKTEEVEIEIVECSSCGQEIPKDKAHEFEIKGKNEADSLTGVKAGVGSHGWACDYCVETQISFPVIYRTLGENTNFSDLALTIGFLTFSVMLTLKSVQILLALIM
jgi:ribosomal protein S26